jgi:predicted Fe-Mo cluster-binding NifX family protein
MKIAISASEPNAASGVDQRFGRACGFMIYDSDSSSWLYVENAPNLKAVQGAGIQAAEMLANNGVNVVLTGHCGPKAFRVLTAASIEIYVGCTGTISEALAKYQAGELQPTTNPDVEGHWS